MNGHAPPRRGRPSSQPPMQRYGGRPLDAERSAAASVESPDWTRDMVSCLTTIRERPLRFRQSEVGIFHPASLFADNFDELEMELRAGSDDSGRQDMDNSVPVWNSSFCFVDALRRYAARGPEYRRILVPQIPSLLRGDALEWWYSVSLDAGQLSMLRNPDAGLNLWCTMLEERFDQNPAMFMQVLNVESFTLQDVADQKNFATWVFRLAHKALVANYRLPGLVMLIYERLDVYLMEEFPYPDVKKGLDTWVRHCMRVIPELYIKCTEGAWRDLVNGAFDDEHASDSRPSSRSDEEWPLPPNHSSSQSSLRRHSAQPGYERNDWWASRPTSRPSSRNQRTPSRPSRRAQRTEMVPSTALAVPVAEPRNGHSRKPRSEVQRLHQTVAALEAIPVDASGGRWIPPELHEDLLHILGNISIGPPPPPPPQPQPQPLYDDDVFAPHSPQPVRRRLSRRGTTRS